MNEIIGIDIGYSSTKVSFRDRNVKFPTAICFATDVGTKFGEDNVYEFEGESYYVGKEAVSEESFTTTDYKFLSKFAPLITYHVLKKFDEHHMDRPIELRTGLSITDWEHKKEFANRLRTIEVNGDKITTDPKLVPQGAGVITDWVVNNNKGEYPDRISVIDIGHNTINVLSYVNGKPVRRDINGYPGHGVTSILKPFTAYLENTYSINFSEQEAIQIFIKGYLNYNGELQTDVSTKILELKKQFVSKLFNSVLINAKKTMAISNVVLLAGGGSILLQDIEFPKNVILTKDPVFSNVRGFIL